MILTDKAQQDFLKWYKENYSHLSITKYNSHEDFENFLDSNRVLNYSLIIMWFDRFRNIGNGKSIQDLIKKCLKDYICAMTWIDMQKYVIEKANKIYNDKYGKNDR
jgi:hypothetical protein